MVATGSRVRMVAVRRPWALAAFTCPFSRNRSRITYARRDRISLKLPPVCFCSSTDEVKKRTSSSGTRMREIAQRDIERRAQVLLVEQRAELLAQRIGHLLAEHFQADGEGVAGAHGARQKVQRFGELLFQRIQPLRALRPHHEVRNRAEDAGPAQQPWSAPLNRNGHHECPVPNARHHHQRHRSQQACGRPVQARPAGSAPAHAWKTACWRAIASTRSACRTRFPSAGC